MPPGGGNGGGRGGGRTGHGHGPCPVVNCPECMKGDNILTFDANGNVYTSSGPGPGEGPSYDGSFGPNPFAGAPSQ